jgi:hypothetical protein
LRLRYTAGGEYDEKTGEIDETFWLERIPQPFGGYQVVFHLPFKQSPLQSFVPAAWRVPISFAPGLSVQASIPVATFSSLPSVSTRCHQAS